MPESKTLEALFPGARRLVLSAMFSEPERWWSLADLAGLAGVQAASLQAYIGQLRRGGVIRECRTDGGVLFRADSRCPVFEELQAIVVKLTPAQTAGETVLVVEDTVATAQITRILLESWGYQVLEAHGAAEALDVSDAHPDEIHLLLSDVNMPGLTGPQLADELRRRRPTLRVVFMSGGPADQVGGMEAFLSKPFNPSSLSQTIRKTLDDVA